MGLHFSTVYVREVSLPRIRRAIFDLMSESERIPILERGLEPTPDSCTAHKHVRSFALMPEQDGWVAVLEDGHSLDDGGLAEGLSDVLQAETLLFAYSVDESAWSFTKYWEGQPLEAGGSDDVDFDAAAMEFVGSTVLPHFGIYYEEVAAAAGGDAPSLAGSTAIFGEIMLRVPLGTEVLTFQRPGKPLPA